MPPVKVYIAGSDHSSGRGVGIYADHLIKSLGKLPDIKLTDKDPDIIHYPFFDLFYPTLPLKKEKPTIVTIHDLTPLVMADRYPKGIRGTINLLRQWYSLRSVSAIITDSESSKRDIEKYFRISPEKIFVTPLAVDDDYKKQPSAAQLAEVKKKFHLPDRFILTLAAGPNPNKNLPSLAEVTDRLGIPLVIVGKGMLKEVVKPVHPELIDLVRLQVYNHVIYPGFVSNEDFNTMFHLASLYVQPSYYEGFGLPLLEAMTSGCLIASSKTSSLPEIYHDEAITFDPRKLKSMEKAIKKALSLSPSAKAKQISLAKDKAKTFSWSKTAQLTSEIYQAVKNGKTI
ncbi:MAG: Glycosyl transferase group 1 [Microgenomates group bacterium GW2011_GWC1_44_37]|uniref:Glycosyl transferase group 1 n=1 Tax=Candidatus Collierbacteria bacterium GW2011_GWB2_44_22 TaxID=1618387 RepID=A0A0G1KX01_9BACT|nr:MAG: Glycosyl transferase group 1 [Candidatus Collierbacteria bacterium GW2011_GWA2_44_13]KKT52469.1 MAG: Glycosyl transferase group 1 [Candidatus Collierbacteria bacterium GW2011_GWB2_44_22]KKT62692.1 MAG: Glycosyl transferase group 1 [Candidatus Collierbacteria bacterium GW2011_GWD1_44_27]KKT65540.1 MAG: Glycosyl transferase group 1 [Candidatus Collierbacteria bacterium GW2011_GWC2_44_30]KKT69172.1 MAG: Glycosyl transferase group 1 [Microgenomates group bacterium GW2011_GWC1_44_37]KKT8913